MRASHFYRASCLLFAHLFITSEAFSPLPLARNFLLSGSEMIAGVFLLLVSALYRLLPVFLGYTTELDLSKYRTYFFMALIGLVIAMVINMFLNSSGLDLIISMAGVLIFTVLTAYDTQRIKRMAADPALSEDGSLLMKISIRGALTLYLDFVNLFLFLLRLFGRRR